jgi:hypothetical protein
MTSAPEGKWHLPRTDGRAATDFVVEVYHGDGKTLRGISRLLDLSVSGACVDSTSDWNEGEEVVIHVLLDTRTLLVLARWSDLETDVFQDPSIWLKVSGLSRENPRVDRAVRSRV